MERNEIEEIRERIRKRQEIKDILERMKKIEKPEIVINGTIEEEQKNIQEKRRKEFRESMQFSTYYERKQVIEEKGNPKIAAIEERLLAEKLEKGRLGSIIKTGDKEEPNER